jgi:hypothetical protein
VNQCLKASQEGSPALNLTDLGWVAARIATMMIRSSGELGSRFTSPGSEVTVNVYGVAVTKPQEHSWAPRSLKGEE